jgi:hypothetical protein
VAPLIWGGTTSIVAQYVHFIFLDDRLRWLLRSRISQITRRLLAKSRRTSIDLDRRLDRSAGVDRKSHFDRISIGISNKRSPARSLETIFKIISERFCHEVVIQARVVDSEPEI